MGKYFKGAYNSSRGTHVRGTERHLLYRLTQCYLPPDTGERETRQGGTQFTRRDRRLSWPCWLIV